MTFTCSPLLGCWARCTLTYRFLYAPIAYGRLATECDTCAMWVDVAVMERIRAFGLIRIAHMHYVLSGIFACRIFVPRFWHRKSTTKFSKWKKSTIWSVRCEQRRARTFEMCIDDSQVHRYALYPYPVYIYLYLYM